MTRQTKDERIDQLEMQLLDAISVLAKQRDIALSALRARDDAIKLANDREKAIADLRGSVVGLRQQRDRALGYLDRVFDVEEAARPPAMQPVPNDYRRPGPQIDHESQRSGRFQS